MDENMGESRRTYGTGSIGKRNGIWYARVEAGYTRSGARRRIERSASDEADAKRRLKEIQRQLAAEEDAGASHRTTVKTWADEWLPIHATKVRPSAYTTDAGAVRRWIIPTIGHRRLSDLTPRDVRAVRKAIEDAGRSTTTARQAHYTLTGMLRAARDDGKKVPLIAIETAAPGAAAHDRDAIPLDQVLALLKAADGTPDMARWVAALLQGMRQGEVLGLTWDCVDIESGRLDVSWQLQSLPYREKRDRTSGFRVPDGFKVRHLSGSYHLTRPKTAAGQRIVPLVPWMGAALAAWREVAPANPWGLVWSGVDARNGKPRVTVRRSSVDLAAWYALQDVAGVRHPSGRRYVLHEARHTAASLLLDLGYDTPVVQSILGQSSIQATRGYQHVNLELARRALNDLAGRLALEG